MIKNLDMSTQMRRHVGQLKLICKHICNVGVVFFKY